MTPSDALRALDYPVDGSVVLRKKKSLRRLLLAASKPRLQKRVAILGGSTTAEVRELLELFLLRGGIQPIFYESDFNRYYEEGIFGHSALDQFKPDLIYIHTTSANLQHWPSVQDSPDAIQNLTQGEIERLARLWDSLSDKFGCAIIQNNFDPPAHRLLGNLDFSDPRGQVNWVHALNAQLGQAVLQRPNLYIQDIHHLSARLGLDRWHDRSAWHAYKYAMGYDAIPALAHNLASMVLAIFGKSKKCLVLDLDNTLWGGIIGDDGVPGLRLGRETPEAEAFTEFQTYALGLRERGILLAVCSKNEDLTAREGFSHPDTVLKLTDFSAFKAGWGPKSDAIAEIAAELNLGVDSLVFVDDNPAEREIVRAQLPGVAVPEVGSDVTLFPAILEASGLFETVSLSRDDLQRAEFYQDNQVRAQQERQFENYADFLRSLHMIAEIDFFREVYLERITQLTNKSNQFNLTTRRYTSAEIQAVGQDRENFIGLYGRLEDKFGDNGLVTVVIGERRGETLDLVLWLMSCRVLKRDMEFAMFDRLVTECQLRKIREIRGRYLKTEKNAMVADLYGRMGFEIVERTAEGNSSWKYVIPASYTPKTTVIQIQGTPVP